MSGMNLGYRTSRQIREQVETAIRQISTETQMLCNELQMHEGSYEILMDERNMLLDRVRERDAEIAKLKADLSVDAIHWRELCDSIAKARDDARREVCELDANGSLEAGTPTAVAADRGWQYLYEKEVVS